MLTYRELCNLILCMDEDAKDESAKFYIAYVAYAVERNRMIIEKDGQYKKAFPIGDQIDLP